MPTIPSHTSTLSSAHNDSNPMDIFVDAAPSDEFDSEAKELLLQPPPPLPADREEARVSGRKRLNLYCFHCNRPESHFHTLQGKWYFSYMLGFSFGLLNLTGPFRCVCCGHKRLSRLNHMHPRMIGRSVMGKQTSVDK